MAILVTITSKWKGPCVLELDFVVLLKCEEEREQMTKEMVGDKWIGDEESRKNMYLYDS